jgi:predicted ArsR family transcriptional regulator
MGAGYDIVTAVILFAFIAPTFTLYAFSLYEAKRTISAIIWGILAASFTLMNTTIALGGISTIREMANDRNANLIRADKQRTNAYKTQDKRIKAIRAAIGAKTSYEFIGQIQVLKSDRIYARSHQCTDVTLPDSQQLCQKIAKANSHLLMAQEVEKLEERRARDAWSTSTNIESVPQVQDAQIANISALVVSLFNIVPEHRLLIALLSGVTAIMLELAADLGPVAVWGLFKLRGGVNDRPVKPVMTDGGVIELSRWKVDRVPCQTAETGHQKPVTPVNVTKRGDERTNVIPFTMSEGRTIAMMRKEGVTWKKITKELGISESTARRRMQSEIESQA